MNKITWQVAGSSKEHDLPTVKPMKIRILGDDNKSVIIDINENGTILVYTPNGVTLFNTSV